MKHSHKKPNDRNEVHVSNQQSGTHKNHPEANEAIDLVKEPFHEMEKHAKIANERLRDFLEGLTKEEMIGRINQLQLSDKHLNFLCEGIILDKDNHEIVLAIEEVRKGRPINLADDPIDHLNYTEY